jgi:hypothetical protein
LKLLELFAGSRSIGKVAKRRGWQVTSVDLKPFKDIDLVADINTVDVRGFPFSFQTLSGRRRRVRRFLHHHWDYREGPKSDAAVDGIRAVLSTLRVIAYFGRCNPRLIYYIENPRGKLRTLPPMQGMAKATVCYCRYGDIRMKPTDIWTNNLAGPGNALGWRPRRMCSPGNPNCHHEQCGSGGRCGTRGLRNAYERSKIPTALARDILAAAERVKRFKR